MTSKLSKISSALTSIRVWVVNLLTLFVLAYFVFLAIVFLRQMPQSVDPEGRVLIINPEGVVVDQAVYPRRAMLAAVLDEPEQIQLRDLITLIRAAAEDDRLSGVLLDFSKTAFNGASTVLAVAEELGKLSESGKPVIAYSEALTTTSYLLAAQADEVYVHPAGAVGISGLGGYRSYFRELLEKLKVSIHNYSQGDFKSAIEPFTRNDMSEADRRQSEALLTALWRSIKTPMAEARSVDAGVVQQLADDFPAILPEAAYDNLRFAEAQGLIDGSLTYAEFRSMMMDKFGVDEDAERETYPHITAAAYRAHLEEPSRSADAEISVVYVQGIIQQGENRPGIAGATDIARLMREAYENESTRAIVLRVNSPGGGLLASELIRDEVLAARKRSLPVVVSMGDVAASGGMFVSAPADRIFAHPTTITGSIGVAIAFPTFENSLDHLGISSDGVTTSRFAGWGLNRPVDDALDAILEKVGGESYQRFIDIVSEGRQREETYIRSIAGGRVWTGERAFEIGLVDELGDFEAALAAAAAMAGLEEYRVKHRVIDPPLSAVLVRRFASDIALDIGFPPGAVGQRLEELFENIDLLTRPQVNLLCARCMVKLQ